MIDFQKGWQVHVTKGPADFNIRLYFLQTQGDKVFIARPLDEGTWQTEELKEGLDPIKPSLVMSHFLYKALIEEVHKEPSPVKEAVDAELTATKYHLEDLRKIVFKE